MTTPNLKMTRKPSYGDPREILSTAMAIVIVVVFWSLASACVGQDLSAEKIYACEFLRSDDLNADQLPDNWRRRRDREHPPYIDIKIVSRDPALAQTAVADTRKVATLLHALEVGYWDDRYTPEVMPDYLHDLMDQAYGVNSCLEMRMDGSSAELQSPKFPLDSRFSYNFEAELSSDDLAGHAAWVELQLLDVDDNLIDTFSTRKIGGTTAWTSVSTDVLTDVSKRLAWGRIHLKAEPIGYSLSSGTVRFDSIRVYRLPRLLLATTLPNHIARPGENIDILCSAMGISSDRTSVMFELRDFKHELISRESVPLEVATANQSLEVTDPTQPHYVSKGGVRAPKPAQETSGIETRPEKLSTTFDGQAAWVLNLQKPGLYRVRVDLGEGGMSQRREILLGVVPTQERLPSGPFGWSIPKFDGRLTLEELPVLVESFGAGWIKLPVWFEVADTKTSDRLVSTIERLQTLGTKCIGRIDQPPASQRSVFGEGDGALPAVVIFRDSKQWEPVLEPVLTRIGLKLDWFQLDGEADSSLMNLANVTATLTDVRARMQNYSQELKLAINWNWLESNLEGGNSILNAVLNRAEPQLTAAELLSYSVNRTEGDIDKWVALDPLAASKYGLLDRVRDLTERMIAIRRAKIEAAFVSNPIDADTGLFDSNLALNEMLIPWMTLTKALGTANYIGSIRFPGDSINHVFESGGQGIMLVWNDRATTEQIYLGDQTIVTDIWGNAVDVMEVRSPSNALEQRFSIDSWPLIIRGVDTNVIRWRQAFAVTIENLASTLGEQELPLLIENSFPDNVAGTIKLSCDTLVRDDLPELQFQLSSRAKQQRKFPIVLRQDASAGKHDLRFDFDITTDKGYRFSIHREITLGMGDIEFEWETIRLNAQQIKLRVELTNNTRESVSFDCKIFPPGTPYQRFQLLGAGPGTTVREVNVTLSDQQKSSLIWLRCEEIGTGRILNYRIGGSQTE
jgi:hypothetical protein